MLLFNVFIQNTYVSLHLFTNSILLYIIIYNAVFLVPVVLFAIVPVVVSSLVPGVVSSLVPGVLSSRVPGVLSSLVPVVLFSMVPWGGVIPGSGRDLLPGAPSAYMQPSAMRGRIEGVQSGGQSRVRIEGVGIVFKMRLL